VPWWVGGGGVGVVDVVTLKNNAAAEQMSWVKVYKLITHFNGPGEFPY
jgi:hypothetical protein